MLQLGGVGGRPAQGAGDADWVVRAQDGRAEEVLAEIGALLGTELPPAVRVRALYAQAIALRLLGRGRDAVRAVHALTALCRDLNLVVTGLRARALLAELLRGSGATELALEELAQAVAMEPGLQDLHDPEVQAALGALAVALRMSGVGQAARRVEARLDEVEDRLPLHQRLWRASNLAFEQAVAAMAAARRPPYRPDVAGLRVAVARIRRGVLLAAGDEYAVVADEADVLEGLLTAVAGDPQQALDRLQACARVLGRGPEAVMARNLWACARVRALRRAGRHREALAEGHRLLGEIESSGYQGDRLALAFEVLRAEEVALGTVAGGARAYLELAEDRMQHDAEQVEALFRTRVAALRAAEERRVLARQARLDSLTGLLNRRGAVDAVTAAARRPDPVPLALLLIDLDGFGRVNDACGRLAGDATLQRVASAVRVQAGPQDVVARWSGDEFLVLTAADDDAAVALGDRIRDAVREGGGPSPEEAVTASVGVAVRAGPVPDAAWLRRAEQARHAAWRCGGDTTVVGRSGVE